MVCRLANEPQVAENSVAIADDASTLSNYWYPPGDGVLEAFGVEPLHHDARHRNFPVKRGCKRCGGHTLRKT